MIASRFTIERLVPPVDRQDVTGLAELLVDAVESGAAVSFLSPLTMAQADAWWRDTLAGADPRAIFLVARADGGVAGSVQLHPAWPPNQPHRGEVAKLLVHRRFRGHGLGRGLMQALEEAARRAQYRLLTLDTKGGSTAERLYAQLGWTRVGEIPGYAYDPDGVTPHSAVIFYRRLDREESTQLPRQS
ncbi:MAG TPA: GNAT family N-acetyltransferase [Vicinamibacterales bacterium]|nr:GNAT family N-acetyltransferase [Vicinamibacterales bacterium]